MGLPRRGDPSSLAGLITESGKERLLGVGFESCSIGPALPYLMSLSGLAPCGMCRGLCEVTGSNLTTAKKHDFRLFTWLFGE